MIQQPVDFVRSPCADSFRRLISVARSDLLLVSPFVKRQATAEVISTLRSQRTDNLVRLKLVTNLRPENILNGSVDLDAASDFSDNLSKFELVHLPSLHAKVYVADEQAALITSANLTQPGLEENLEYGVSVTDPSLVRSVRRDWEEYSRLGAKVEASTLKTLLAESTDLKEAFLKAERSIRSDARRALQQKLDAINLQLLKERARGQTAHSVFADSIIFLLKGGPLPTTAINARIKQLHPDLCDDSVNRVIDGVHFGKKWKHGVRTAQVFLRRKGVIRRHGDLWRLVAATRAV